MIVFTAAAVDNESDDELSLSLSTCITSIGMSSRKRVKWMMTKMLTLKKDPYGGSITMVTNPAYATTIKMDTNPAYATTS